MKTHVFGTTSLHEDESQEANGAEQLIQQSLHPDLSQTEHSRTLARRAATTAELLHTLEELEYHVHHIDGHGTPLRQHEQNHPVQCAWQ